MSKDTYDIRSRWLPDGEGPDDIADRSLRTLDQLKTINPTISNWRIIDWSNWTDVALAEVRSQMPAFVAQNVHRHYEDNLPDPSGGYLMFAKSADEPGAGWSPNMSHLDITAGSKRSNSLDFSVGSLEAPPDLSLVTYPLYRQALEIIASNWPVPWGWARCMHWSDVPSKSWTPPPAGSTKEEWLASMAAVQPPGPIEMLWILYLSAPFVRGLAPPSELKCDPTPGGGVILSAMLERPDPNNADHMRRARLLGQILEERIGEGRYPALWGPRIGPY